MAESHITNLIRREDFRRKWREDRNSAERILRQRRDRYANDPEYAESIKESVRRQREKRGPSNRKRSFNRDKVIIINGTSVTLYSIGKASRLVGVSGRTLKAWEDRGLIPINRWKDSLGRRWYPAEFVSFLSELASNRPKGRLDGWSARVKEVWQETQLSNRRIPIVDDHL